MALLSKISWIFNDEYYSDRDKFNAKIYQDDWKPDEIIHNYSVFNFIYYAWINKPKEILNNERIIGTHYGRHKLLSILKAENDKYFTSIELMMKIHNQMCNKDLGDHIFFEGIDLNQPLIDGEETFEIYCGS